MDRDGNGYVSQTEVVAAFKKASGKDQKLTYKKMRRSCQRRSVKRGAAKCEYVLIDGNEAIIKEHNVNPGGFGAESVYFVADDNLDRKKLWKFQSYLVGQGDNIGNFVNVDDSSKTKVIDFRNINDRTRAIRVHEKCSK